MGQEEGQVWGLLLSWVKAQPVTIYRHASQTVTGRAQDHPHHRTRCWSLGERQSCSNGRGKISTLQENFEVKSPQQDLALKI